MTTIQVSEEVKEKLDELKVHPRESYNEALEDLLVLFTERNMPLHPDLVKRIEEGLAEAKAGKGVSTEEMLRRLGVKK